MQKINLSTPLLEIDLWLNNHILVSINEMRVSDKVSSSEAYSSTGIEISIKHSLASKIKDMEMKHVTLGALEDTMLASCMKDSVAKELIPFAKTITPSETNDKVIEDYMKDCHVSKGNFPTGIALKYPEMTLLFKFKEFSFVLTKEVLESSEVISQFLYYKTRFLENNLPLPAPKNFFLQKAFEVYFAGYKQFLLQIMLENLKKIG